MSQLKPAEESRIRLVDEKTGRDFGTAAGSAIVRSSSRIAWRSPVVFEIHHMPAHEYEEHVTVGHQLLVNLGAPVGFGWREDGRRSEGVLKTGALCIQSDGAANAPRWDESMTFATAAIPPAMIQDLLQDGAPAPAATFAKRHCVDDPLAHGFVRSLGAELASPTEPLYAEALSQVFVGHLLRLHGPASGRKQLAPKGTLSPAQLRNILEMIHADLGSNLSISRMASSCGYSP
ncbi:MAG: Transcriptional regulator, AraC family, partial [Labilithrix sp.]|nr:Transcriptional regulator, AraC family [Labilithrix sp.]